MCEIFIFLCYYICHRKASNYVEEFRETPLGCLFSPMVIFVPPRELHWAVICLSAVLSRVWPRRERANFPTCWLPLLLGFRTHTCGRCHL